MRLTCPNSKTHARVFAEHEWTPMTAMSNLERRINATGGAIFTIETGLE